MTRLPARGILPLALVFALAAVAARAADAPPAARSAPARPAARGVHFLYLVRHGMYDRDDHADEVTGNGLDALGHQQAKLLGARLAASGVTFHSLVSSDYLRARQTADDIGAQLHMTTVVDTLIHECTPTELHPEYATQHSAADIAQCVSNLEAAWSRYFTPTPGADTWDLLVCHGNVIRWLTLKAMGADTTRWFANDIGNASLTVIAVRPDGTCRLVTYSDTGHIPVDQQTWAGRGPGWGGSRGNTTTPSGMK